MEGLRTSSASKPKFSFKRKANKGKEVIELTSSVHMDEKVSITTDMEAMQEDAKEDPSFSHVSLSGMTDSYITWTSLPLSKSSATDLAISNLTRCVVNLLPDDSNNTTSISALHVRNLTDTVLLLPRIDGSALLHDMKNCTIVLGCHQVRVTSASCTQRQVWQI